MRISPNFHFNQNGKTFGNWLFSCECERKLLETFEKNCTAMTHSRTVTFFDFLSNILKNKAKKTEKFPDCYTFLTFFVTVREWVLYSVVRQCSSDPEKFEEIWTEKNIGQKLKFSDKIRLVGTCLATVQSTRPISYLK